MMKPDQILIFRGISRSLYIVREQSIRFIRVSERRVMAAQLVGALERVEGLEEVRVVTPGVEDATAREQERRRELDEVDRRLRGTVKDSRA